MKITKIIALLLTALCLFRFSVSAETGETDITATDTYEEADLSGIDSGTPYLGTEKIIDNVGSAILYETNSNTLMYSYHADEKVYPSSLVKIMTALIAVEKGNLEDTVTVSQTALDSVPYYAASAELQVDEQLTVSDLLYCMMVGSANDAAAVIAEHISGSQAAFVQEMNAYAAALGCAGTQYVNPHGLHDENQYTTTRDLARILAAAVNNASFMTFFSEASYTVPATNKSEERSLTTSNFLISTVKLQKYYDERVTGGRTGIADDDSRCLATVAETNGMKVICVVMGSLSTLADDGQTESYGSFAETSGLLDVCFRDNHVVQVVYEKQVLKQCPVTDGENDVLLATADSVYSVLPSSVSLSDLVFKYDDTSTRIEAPVSAGQRLSGVQVWYNGTCIARTDLIAMNDVRFVDTTEDVEVPDDNGFVMQTPFVIILSVVGGVVVLLLVIRGARYLRLMINRKQPNRKKR